MEAIYIVLPLAIVMAVCAVAAFFWSVRSGQMDDLDTPRYRALFDDNPMPPRPAPVLSPVRHTGRIECRIKS